ncbi:orotidine-5'-phosphate decarboxylase [Williamsia deligens]|uniref:Orotidine 5'-phosphate decarboxylase n=1 Tax=Williamsia deligens TaxID=321325 RepID=A0ABW3GC50_9NOCA|nr:orotidine-5'-phosphate decarboxylase [Williamsia deligens]MCP2195322.1 orotidine-5'-phosphate decarboxylase [Williamsia deligens]
MTADFTTRVRAVIGERGRLCVGIDPHPALLEGWGLDDDADGVRAFTETVVEAIGHRVALVKPQVAFYERHGSAGVAVLEDAIVALRAAGALVVADAKRGDIGTTMAAYAHTWLNDASPLCSDAMTASPYLGVGALEPAVSLADETGRGVFVLARTSNSEGATLQTAVTADGRTVAQAVVDDAAAHNARGPAAVGLVVGATREHGLDLHALGGPILAPGLGAQGATAPDLARVFAGTTELLLPSASRQVLAAGPDRSAVAAAADALRDEVESALR